MQLELLPHERTIGVNRVLWNGYDPAHLVIADGDVWKDIRDDALKAKCQLLVGTDPTRRGLYDQIKDELPTDRTTMFIWEEGADTWGGRIKRSIAGFMSTQIAAMMADPGGRVWLCGMDLTYRDGEPTHSYDREGTGTRDAPFPKAINDFVRLRAALTANVSFCVVGQSTLTDHDFPSVSISHFNNALLGAG